MRRITTSDVARLARRALAPNRRSAFVFNPMRHIHRRQKTGIRQLLLPLTRLGLWCGFTHVDYCYVHGDRRRLHIGERCGLMNTTFNVYSGDIHIGDDTLFSHGCNVLTGRHRFFSGRRAGLQPDAPYDEVPSTGGDIRIGSGCFIGAGASILGGVTIGDDVIIGAGAVVTIDVPAGSFAAGVPARVIDNTQPEQAPASGPACLPG